MPESRLVIHRSRTDAEALPPLPVRELAMGPWLAALADPATIFEIVVERPAYWEFAGLWSCPWRSLGFHLLYLVVQGEGRLWLGDAPPHRLATGTAFWIPPHIRHRLEQTDGRNYFVRFRLVADGSSLSTGAPRVVDSALHLLPWFQQLSDDLRFGHAWLGERMRAALALIATDGRGRGDGDDAGRLGPAQRRRIAQLAEESWADDLAPADLARAVGMSPGSFARAFRRSFGCPPRRWLADQRLHRVAQRLLADQRPVEAVAAAAGFANPSQFARRFRAVFGVSPAQWRRTRGL